MECRGHYIVCRVDGTVEVNEFKGDTTGFFRQVKTDIGAETGEVIEYTRDATGKHILDFVCDEEAYMKWDAAERPKHVNRVGTCLYNGMRGGEKVHHILGDIAFVAQVAGEDGDELVPFGKPACDALAAQMRNMHKTLTEKVPLPAMIADPVAEVISFKSQQELVDYLTGKGRK